MNRRPISAHVNGWDRAAVVALGAAGCSLSYSAMQQMAVGIHVRPALCWLFPLAIDGFIAYGVRALLVLRSAPLMARLYVWTLFGTATAVSVWANALHAVRLNRATTSATAFRLGDSTVAALSMVAPLALAGAVHLFILIARSPDKLSPTQGTDRACGDAQPTDAVRTGAGMSEPGQSLGTAPDRLPPRPPTAPGPTASATGDQDSTASSRPSAAALSGEDGARTPADRRHGQDLDQLMAIARRAALAEGKLTRKVVAQAIRAQGIPLSNDTLTGVMDLLRPPPGHPGTVSRD